MARPFERVIEFPQPAMIALLRVLVVPAAPARVRLRPRHEVTDVLFGLLLAVLIAAVCRRIKQRIHSGIDEPVCNGIVGTKLRFQEKLCTRLNHGRELRAQSRKEIRDRKRNDTEPYERDRTGFQHIIHESH